MYICYIRRLGTGPVAGNRFGCMKPLLILLGKKKSNGRESSFENINKSTTPIYGYKLKKHSIYASINCSISDVVYFVSLSKF